MSRRLPVLRMLNQSGQGFIEYILLVVVIITIALAISARLFKPFNQWAKHYIGDYLYCVLDQGELPSLGGKELVSDCESQYEGFSLAGGRGRKGSGSGDGDGDGANKDNKNSGDKGKSGSGGGNGRGAGGSVNGKVSGGRSRSALGSGFESGQKSKEFAAGTNKNSGDNVGGKLIVTQYYGGNFRGNQRQVETKYSGLRGIIEREQEKIKKREDKIRSVSKSEAGIGGGGFQSKKTLPVSIAREKLREADIKLDDWSIGSTLRTIFIIVIIIALALFLAGQVAQINKSMEKE